MDSIPVYTHPAGYLPAQYREILEYKWDRYLMLVLHDHRTGETKIHRRIYLPGKGWSPFRPWNLTKEARLGLVPNLHQRGFWAPLNISLYLQVPVETINKLLEY